MRAAVTISVGLSILALAAAAPIPVRAQGKLADEACANLAGDIAASAIGMPTGGAKIETAALQAPAALALAERGPTPASRVAPATPAFCKLTGSIAPVDPAAPPIRFQINLPAQWNGKALQFGGGGFNGTLITGLGLVAAAPFDRPAPLALGFVTYGTDSGHELRQGEAPQTFAANDEAFVNFAHAAYKKLRDVAGVTVEKAYGRKATRVYFAGSSEGGREALTMAQRYPADFDGVFARVPVINWTGLMHVSARAGFVTMGEGWLSAKQAQLVQDAVLKACDAADGVADGLVADAPACLKSFKVSALKCARGQDGATCLNEAQINAIDTYRSPYKFPFALANGVTEYPGWGISGEAAAPSGPTGGWGAWWTGASAPTWPPQPTNGISWVYGSGALAHIFARDPKFDVATYKPENFKPRVLEVSALMDSTNPDLSAFHARGGKVIMLENMADYAQSPYAGIGYYENVVKTMGKEKADGMIRLFTAPGVDHVGWGAPGNVDMLSALDAWVEKGVAPAGLTVIEQEIAAPAFAVKRALPLCEWPAVPRYKAGDVKAAGSFSCVRP